MNLSKGNKSLNAFLQRSKEGIKKLSDPNQQKFKLVVGNEAMDLDSIVTSILYAYFLDKNNSNKDVILPLLQIPREDFSLRTDVVWLFKEVKLDWNNLIFLSDYEQFLNANHLKSFNNDNLKVVLTDHNVLSRNLSVLNPFVEEIIDHHVDEGKYDHVKGEKRNIEMVGSATTLVAKKMGNDALEGNTIPSLLLGTILLDTVNLAPEFNRATPEDVRIAGQILKYLRENNEGDIEKFRGEFFETLQKERFDQYNLSTKDLLRVDYKQFTMDTKSSKKYEVGISSSKIKAEDWLSKDPEIIKFFKEFSDANRISILYSMTTHIVGEDTKRELFIYSHSENELADKSVQYLLDDTDLNLKEVDLTEWKEKNRIQGKEVYFRLFHQGNTKASRKQVQPFVSKFFASFD